MVRELDRKEVQALLGGLSCEKEFLCGTSLDHLCRSRRVGLDEYLECLEDEYACTFSYRPGGDVLLCGCPLRIYLHRILGM